MSPRLAWLKLRAWPWWRALLTLLAGLALALVSARVTRREVAGRAAAHRAEQLAADRSRQAVERAARLAAGAEAHKVKAEQIRTTAENRLDAMAKTDDSVADMVERWNRDRLRNRTG